MEKVPCLKRTTIPLICGTYFDFLKPDISEFCIVDIAHALSQICRFTGHTPVFYSVAQHSVLVSKAVPPEYAYAGLMHDAAEAFIGDVSSPLKQLLPDYKKIEERVEAAVFKRFNLPAKLPDCVKVADIVLLRTEQRDVMGADAHHWVATDGVKPMKELIVPMSSVDALDAFLMRYNEVAPTPDPGR